MAYSCIYYITIFKLYDVFMYLVQVMLRHIWDVYLEPCIMKVGS